MIDRKKLARCKRIAAMVMRKASAKFQLRDGREFELPKKLTSSELNLLNKLDIGEDYETVRNPIMGGSARLHPIAVALYDFIMGCQMTGGPRGSLVKDFDTAMGIFTKNWPSEYMTLLD